ncbi:MAG: S-layer homology domain-containing protein, partial [Clostridia bacterium]|nr:S-layer homology domain-containing protein [Clostridia bacterium]
MKRVIAMVVVFTLILQVLPVGADFSGLGNHWSRNYVRLLEREGIVSGKTADTFDPEGIVTRAEFVSLAVRLANLLGKESSPYTDVAESAWFAPAVSAAKEFGALDNDMTADGAFYPDRPITREEMTSVIVRMTERICGTLLNVRTDFTDADTFSECYADYIAKAAGEGIVTGNPGGTFNPRGNATRAEAAVIIKRFYDLLHRAPRRLEAGEYHPVYDGIIYEVDLQSMITDAYQKGERSITLEKGVYRLKPHRKDGHLNFTDMKDFTVYGNGSTLLYQSPGAAGVVFKNSENIHLMNLNTDCELLTCEQGRITAINTEDFYIEFVVPNGYRDHGV